MSVRYSGAWKTALMDTICRTPPNFAGLLAARGSSAAVLLPGLPKRDCFWAHPCPRRTANALGGSTPPAERHAGPTPCPREGDGGGENGSKGQRRRGRAARRPKARVCAAVFCRCCPLALFSRRRGSEGTEVLLCPAVRESHGVIVPRLARPIQLPQVLLRPEAT